MSFIQDSFVNKKKLRKSVFWKCEIITIITEKKSQFREVQRHTSRDKKCSGEAEAAWIMSPEVQRWASSTKIWKSIILTSSPLQNTQKQQSCLGRRVK